MAQRSNGPHLFGHMQHRVFTFGKCAGLLKHQLGMFKVAPVDRVRVCLGPVQHPNERSCMGIV